MNRLIAIVIVAIIFAGCRKPSQYSEIPAITFQSFTKTQTTDLLGNKIIRAQLSFYLIDGDGNIGFNDYDTVAPWSPGTEYFNNLHLTFYKVENGSTINDTTRNLAYRTPLY